jgi:hypothetical protein
MEDLFTEHEREEFSRYPSAKNSLASVGLPIAAKWKHLLFNSFPNLYIISPVSSPENSPNTSPENSQHVSPTNTFPREEEQSKQAQQQEADHS